jgi:hypothetical protein
MPAIDSHFLYCAGTTRRHSPRITSAVTKLCIAEALLDAITGEVSAGKNRCRARRNQPAGPGRAPHHVLG